MGSCAEAVLIVLLWGDQSGAQLLLSSKGCKEGVATSSREALSLQAALSSTRERHAIIGLSFLWKLGARHSR